MGMDTNTALIKAPEGSHSKASIDTVQLQKNMSSRRLRNQRQCAVQPPSVALRCRLLLPHAMQAAGGTGQYCQPQHCAHTARVQF